jgi:hypothetical protein
MADKTRTTGLRTGIPSGATGSSPPSFLPRRNLVPTYLSSRRIVMTPWNLFVRFIKWRTLVVATAVDNVMPIARASHRH